MSGHDDHEALRRAVAAVRSGDTVEEAAHAWQVAAGRVRAAVTPNGQRPARRTRPEPAPADPYANVPPPDTPPDADMPATRSWRRVDLTDVLDGRYRPPEPSVGHRDDGVGMFYPGRVHTVASESEGGKTWLALLTVAREMERGRSALYLDFEDEPAAIVGRLLALGVAPINIGDQFGYLRPDAPILAAGNRGDLAAELADLDPSVVVIDGVTEAMTAHGLELKSNTDIARFAAWLPRWIAERGPAVVCLDHVVKDREGRGRYALGGVHKLNGVNGAAYLLDNRAPFGIGRTGRSCLLIAKDRPAQLRRHAVPAADGLFRFADLVIESVTHDGAPLLVASLDTPAPGAEPFRPTVLMGKIAETLQRADEPLSQRGILDRVPGKREAVRQALAALIDEGYVTVADGPRNGQLHTLIKPFEDTNP